MVGSQVAASADAGPERATSGGAPKVELSNQELLKAMPEAEKKKLRAARCCKLRHKPQHPPMHADQKPDRADATAHRKKQNMDLPVAPARWHSITFIHHLTALHWLRRFGGGGAAVGPLSKVDLAEEMRKRKERAKKFGLPVPVFAAEVRSPSPGARQIADVAHSVMHSGIKCAASDKLRRGTHSGRHWRVQTHYARNGLYVPSNKPALLMAEAMTGLESHPRRGSARHVK